MDDHRTSNNPIAVDRRDLSDDAEIVRGLRGLAADIDEFVALQNTRLQQVLDASAGGCELPGDIDSRRSELESRERELEQRQREALEHVEFECEQLTTAWDRLEEQQRQLLAQGAGAAAPANSPQSSPSSPSISTAPMSSLPGSDIDLIGDVGLPAANPASVQPWSREPAAQQFQQMKREIRRHARRRKP
ncbi:MAG: hypothetical protein HON53_13685 [Planctomycetaceae bacterium]|jgi:hypothetical protein|nr:hypothetical protein [Planctomycetaceae bacterium]MBT6154041.1 hypothetical protein [Planctomycetaceae bacterium]MBT6485097.1 hypothetical protein [Planctomycetaceae bacterium]MBT6495910.1 hypothetical protein [Planctomycetaceae bacterium]